MVIAQIAVIVFFVTVAVAALDYFPIDAAEFFALFTGCIIGNAVYLQAPLAPVQIVAILAGCVVGQFVYKKIFRQ